MRIKYFFRKTNIVDDMFLIKGAAGMKNTGFMEFIEKENEKFYSKKGIMLLMLFLVFCLPAFIACIIYIFSQCCAYFNISPAMICLPYHIGLEPLKAFILGLLSFISVRVLPLTIPYLCLIAYVSATTIKELNSAYDAERKKLIQTLSKITFLYCLFIFVLSVFAVICFKSLIPCCGSYELNLMLLSFFTKIGGILIFFLGGCFIASVKTIFIQNKEKNKFDKFIDSFKLEVIEIAGMFIISIVLGFVWISAPIPYFDTVFVNVAAGGGLVLSTNLLLVYYFLGLAIPFVLIAFAFNWLLINTKISKHINKIVFACGILLMLMGISTFFNHLGKISRFFIK